MSIFDPQSFSHLNVHSHYTLMGSTASIPALVEKASKSGLGWLPLTDTQTLSGAVQFSQICEKAEVQPLIGMSVQVAAPGDLPRDLEKDWGILVLMARGPKGYRSLCRLSSTIQLRLADSSHLSEVLPWEVLLENTENLLALEGGREGWLEGLIRHEAALEASHYLSRLSGLFGDQCFVGFEVQAGIDEAVSREVLALAGRYGVPAVPMLPIYCLDEKERSNLRLLTAIKHNIAIQDVPSSLIPGYDDPLITVHWLARAELQERYTPYDGVLEETSLVLKRCGGRALPTGKPIWPVIELPEGRAPTEELRAQALAGLDDIYPEVQRTDAERRLDHELRLIEAGGFAPLFLIVADIARYAREANIPMNTRGSVANSLTAYALGITNVDPLEHDLLFERFLNPERTDLPDIDLDFCSRRRDEVLDYLRQIYGEDHVAMVATVNTMQPRSAVRETAKVYGYDEAEIKRITSGISRWWHPDPRRRGRRGIESALAETSDPTDRKILLAAQELVGQPRHLSVHPGGVVITPGPLTEVVPIQLAPKGFFITQYDHEDVEAIGLPKIDLLGIRALSVVSRTIELIRENINPQFDPETIPASDPLTGDLLERGETIGVFQCESDGAQNTLRKLRARTVKDLAVSNAFFKPGPATGGMAGAFVRRYRGEERVEYLHPALEPILKSTKGVLIFQEQILQVATEIAGLSWDDANQLRRGMSKFKPEEMEALKERFVYGCMRPAPVGPGFDGGEANALWEQVHAFAGYGFNKGHATAYAGLSYRSAYLKCHWPEAFLCARLSERGGYHHPAVYIAEARRLGIEIRPPHVNNSRSRFHLTYEKNVDRDQPVLWMGLNQVRALRRGAALELVDARAEGQFKGVADLSRRVALQERELNHLIQCGALDGLVSNRNMGLVEAERAQRSRSPLQRSFEFMQVDTSTTAADTAAERLAWERRILGMPVSVHPLQVLPDSIDDRIPLQGVEGRLDQRVETYGARLPGWGRGRSFFLSDPEHFIYCRIPDPNRVEVPPAWTPLQVQGAWKQNSWGGGWFEVERIEMMGEIGIEDD
jgi:DNA-directed DNA polymerase III PolC